MSFNSSNNLPLMSNILMESIVICLLGGLVGILFGIIIGNILALGVFDIGFYMPWHWIIGGVVLIVIVAIVAMSGRKKND